MRGSIWVIGAVATAVLLVACGDASGGGRGTDPGDAQEPGVAEFDRDEARERANSVLGVREHDVEESDMVRIVRRGDEELPVTMDLRPGRLNLELDDDGAGNYAVTRVVVEAPDGEDPLVVE